MDEEEVECWFCGAPMPGGRGDFGPYCSESCQEAATE
jgi:endogenous inhibitor of DNA gyrase (YacG/DUF329 family)